MKKNNGRTVKMQNCGNNLLDVEDLKTYFPVRKGLFRRKVLRQTQSLGLLTEDGEQSRTIGYVKAVDGISFAIHAGRTLGLVGESGCGKTTVARSIVRLTPAMAGKVVFDGLDVLSAKRNELRQIRKEVGLIFQDPYSSLNPRMTVGEIIGEPLKVHDRRNGSPREISRCRLSNGVSLLSRGQTPLDTKLSHGVNVMEQVAVLLSKVGLSPECMNRYPHEFSTGQRQRIGIARALVLRPRLVICDEPVSSLDVSIQSQILNLLKDIQDEFALTYLFIAHDLAVVEFFCDIVAVMYKGRIVEQAEAKELYQNPLHPYTQALISAIPQIYPVGNNTASRTPFHSRRFSNGVKPDFGAQTTLTPVPSAKAETGVWGCHFCPRCPLFEDDCLKKMPILEEKSKGHFVACWKCKKIDY